MKHKILVLGMMICLLLGLTACGSETAPNTIEGSRYHPELFTQEYINYEVETIEDNFEKWYLSGVTPDTFESKVYFEAALKRDMLTGNIAFDDELFEVNRSGYDSWYKSLNDLGFGSAETLQSDLNITVDKYELNDDGELVVNATLQGTKRSAAVNVYLANDGNPTDIGVTVNRSNSEKLKNAGLNTLLGMGMAFAILILISLIISLFPILIGGSKKKESDVEIAKQAIDNTTAQIADKEENLAGDEELVAVIAAAIAAYEGSASTEGFQVRSIRRVNTNWKKNR